MSRFLTKRRLVSMMQDVFPRMLKVDRKNLSKRLDDFSNNKSLEAAWELSILWALSQKFSTDFHFSKEGISVKPDALVDIGIKKRVIVEIKALSGSSFSFKNFLDEITKNIHSLCNEILPESQEGIHIFYGEWRDCDALSSRIPAVSKDVCLDGEFRQALTQFLKAECKREIQINISGKINANFKKISYKSYDLKYNCSIPDIPQSILNNVTRKLIDDANRQLVPFFDDFYTCLIVCDGGNDLFSRPDRYFRSGAFSGLDLMRYVVEQTEIDCLVFVGRKDVMAPNFVMSPHNLIPELALNFIASDRIQKSESIQLCDSIINCLGNLPVPRTHLYQEKHYLEQVARRGEEWPFYHTTNVSGFRSSVEEEFDVNLKISSRAFVDLIGGKITASEFCANFLSDITPINLDGKSLFNVTFESGGLESDDDFVVFEFRHDPLKGKFQDLEKSIPVERDSKKKSGQ